MRELKSHESTFEQVRSILRQFKKNRDTALLKYDIGQFESCASELAFVSSCLEDKKRWKIVGKANCARALKDDIVLVWKGDEETRCKVLKVLKRAEDIIGRTFLCRFDEHMWYVANVIGRRDMKVVVDRFWEQNSKGDFHWTKNWFDVPIFKENGERKGKEKKRVIRFEVEQHLFLVKLVCWGTDRRYPLAQAIKHVGSVLTVQQGMPYLKDLYAPNHLKEDVPMDDIPVETTNSTDLTDCAATFTIDAKGTVAIDDAFTFESLKSSEDICNNSHSMNILGDETPWDKFPTLHRIGVHISDVTRHIPKGSPLEDLASRRLNSVYSLDGHTLHMLPSEIGHNECSLKVGEERHCVAVFFIMGQSKPVTCLSDLETGKFRVYLESIDLTKIKSRAALTCSQVESLLNEKPGTQMPAIPSHIDPAIRTMLEYALNLCHQRVPHDFLRVDYRPSDTEKEAVKAHLLVEEFMILTNYAIGKHLLNNRNRVPPILVRQNAPSIPKLQNWITSHSRLRGVSFTVRGMLRKMAFVNSSGDQSLQIPTEQLSPRNVKLSRLALLPSTTVNSPLLMLGFCDESDRYPQVAVAVREYRRMSRPSGYVCAWKNEEHRHFDLNRYAYTHFTSPLRRFSDMVTHRLVKATLPGRSADYRYSAKEIEKICKQCTVMKGRSNRFQRTILELDFVEKVRKKPIVVVATVSMWAADWMEMYHSAFKDLRRPPKVFFRDLDLVKLRQTARDDGEYMEEAEESDEDASDSDDLITDEHNRQTAVQTARVVSQTNLTWAKRIYEVNPSRNRPTNRPPNKPHEAKTIKSDWYFTRLPEQHSLEQLYRKPLHELRYSPCQDFIEVTEDEPITKEPALGPGEELTQEHLDALQYPQLVRLELDSSCAMLKMQLNHTVQQGWASCSVQLVWLTPSLHVCIDHQRNPCECFCQPTGMLRNPRPKYDNIEDYVTTWKALVARESATCAVREHDKLIVRGVEMKWISIPSGFGQFELDEQFCKERGILVGKSTSATSYMFEDFICLTAACDGYTWVGHGTIFRLVSGEREPSEKKKNSKLVFQVELARSALRQPLPSPPPKSYQIEIIRKSDSDRKMERSLHALQDSNPNIGLIQEIFLGQPIQYSDASHSSDRSQYEATLEQAEQQWLNQFQLNEKQREAIHRCWHMQFAMIWGPPGTGKTKVGAFIAYLFALKNKTVQSLSSSSQSSSKVIYCAPSNRAVDVAARYLKDNVPKGTLQVVRVYSVTLEEKVFRCPTANNYSRLLQTDEEAAADPELKDISLHHLIRQEGAKYAKDILAFDRKFKKMMTRKQLASEKDLMVYKKLINDAEQVLLNQSDIILCTCITTARKVMSDIEAEQCILDEAGMTTQPMSLVPLVRCKPKQVVLVGDHMQLQPIVIDNQAKKRGLCVSLFERYQSEDLEEARNSCMVMLDTQYRMHPSISKFPSVQFYNGELKNATLDDSELPFPWWSGAEKKECHVLFLSLRKGLESRDKIASESAGLHSVRNEDEAQLVKKLYNFMKQDEETSLVVLAQYRSQVARIKELDKSIDVTTVVRSQGSEWDYVILSTCRSLPSEDIPESPNFGWKKQHLGFVADPHQINVALTRAKKGLIIVGNDKLLETDDLWRNLLSRCEKFKGLSTRQPSCVQDADDFTERYLD